MKTRFPQAYVLNIMANDRPGIVAAVSGAIVALEGNIDACSQTVLGGYFTQILVVSFPQALEPEELARRVRQSSTAGGPLQVLACPYIAPAPAAPRNKTDQFVITAFGKDKPGIIHRFSQYLAGKDINIVDWHWDCAGEDFVLMAQVEIPEQLDTGLLQADLDELGKEQGFNVRLQHENVFVATNQLRLTAAPRGTLTHGV